MEGYVYLLEDYRNFERAFKIGKTRKTVEQRVKQLQTGNSHEIVIVNYYKSNQYNKLEKFLHTYYAPYRISGEWFVINDKEASNFLNVCKKLDASLEYLKNNNTLF